MKSGLTKRQREIVDYITTYTAEKRCSPSYREIQRFFGFSSLGSVFNHVQTLKNKGILAETASGARSLRLVTEERRRTVPLIGKLRGGQPIEMFPHITEVPFPSPPEHECYLLKVDGEALLEECLQPDDLVLVEPRTYFEDGEMVIALIEKATTVVKRAYRQLPFIRFESVTPHLHPLTLHTDHLEIQGIILSVLRDYSS